MGANFSAGRLKDHVEGWKSLTTDPVILDAIKHYHIEFGGASPPSLRFTSLNKFNSLF